VCVCACACACVCACVRARVRACMCGRGVHAVVRTWMCAYWVGGTSCVWIRRRSALSRSSSLACGCSLLFSRGYLSPCHCHVLSPTPTSSPSPFATVRLNLRLCVFTPPTPLLSACCLSVRPSACLSVCLSVSLCLSVCLSVRLSV
jgi:hypothetical protein